jgi:protein O-mannosyl-transferase
MSAARSIWVATAGLALWLLLAIAWFAYHPGLSGNFMFDDWANLPPLGAMGPIDNWNNFVTYMLSGISSPTGRPVAMLSFLLDANNWPAVPEPFKATNVLIHLLNGTLLAWLEFRLLRIINIDPRRASWVSVLSAGLWLLHPYWVSTTLFIVQRMTMLATTFVLAGLLCYLHGRHQWAKDRYSSAYLWMSTGLGLCGLLATLSKENGALLPLFVLVIETTILNRSESTVRITRASPGWRIWRALFIYFPLSLLGAYILAHLPSMLHADNKGQVFTAGQRLLTESRAVTDYLWHIVVPRAYTAGLYHDNFPLSTSLFHPWTTPFAVLLILGLIAVAWRIRKRYPLVALGILFYFAGQLLESTIIPLELYYEHRNYLPAVLLSLPLAQWLVDTQHLKHWARVSLSVLLLTVLATFTWQRASLWGHPFQLSMVWVKENPQSPRGVTTLALHLMHQGEYKAASEVLKPLAAEHPYNIMLQLNLISAYCGSGGVNQAQLYVAERMMSQTRQTGHVAYNAISRFIQFYKTRKCTGLGGEQLNQLIQAGLDNSNNIDKAGWRQSLHALRGELQLAQHRPEEALNQFKASLAASDRASTALYEAALLGSNGYPRAGLTLLNYYETLPHPRPSGFNVEHLRALWLKHLNYYPEQIAHVRHVLRQDIAAAQRPSSQR